MDIETIKELYSELMLMDGYDDCIVGVSHQCGAENSVVYSIRKIGI